MTLKVQKRIAGKLLKVGINRVWFDQNRLEEIKEAITRADINHLIRDRAIQSKPEKGISSFRNRKLIVQRRKGQRKGQGSRKGKPTSRLKSKTGWMRKIRSQRKFLRYLKDNKLINSNIYKKLYLMCKGGFFRSRRHIKLYLTEHNIMKK